MLTPCVSAQLAIDNHAAKKIDGSVYVSIDSLSYDGNGEGVVDLSGTFFVYNYDEKRKITYSGEIRLEIFDSQGNTLLPHSEKEVSGSLDKNDEDARLWDVYESFSKSTNLHMECLSPEAVANRKYRMDANITLRVTQRDTETWMTSYSDTFWHVPEEDVDQQVGIGPTTDGDTFSDDCTVDSEEERTNWQSLIFTDGPYSAVYWYVKGPEDPADTSAGVSWGDGATRKATMTTSFPEDVDDPNKPGDQDAVWYEITGYVYRWDGSVYTTSYLVWVKDAR